MCRDGLRSRRWLAFHSRLDANWLILVNEHLNSSLLAENSAYKNETGRTQNRASMVQGCNRSWHRNKRYEETAWNDWRRFCQKRFHEPCALSQKSRQHFRHKKTEKTTYQWVKYSIELTCLLFYQGFYQEVLNGRIIRDRHNRRRRRLRPSTETSLWKKIKELGWCYCWRRHERFRSKCRFCQEKQG